MYKSIGTWEEAMGTKNITTNIYRIHENDSITCHCIGFINFMVKVRS